MLDTFSIYLGRGFMIVGGTLLALGAIGILLDWAAFYLHNGAVALWKELRGR